MTMPEQKKAVVPRLRFPEFRDAGPWEVKRLGDVCSTYSGGTPSSSHKEYYGGNIPFIRSAEIDSEVTELHITEAGLLNSSAKLVRKGDILIALYGANSGEAAIARIDGAINQAILCLRSQFNHHYILNYWLLMKHIIILRYLQGGQGNLSGEIVRSIEMPFPTLSEQQKIADCLSSLDEVIELQAKKLEVLQAHKKGLMQQLFPREGETTPRLRFPEFHDAGPWEVKRLGELIETVTPSKKLQTADYLSEGRYPIIDQSLAPIAGWTDDESAVIREHLPLIVFGDHTCVIKIVSVPFCQGADGIKILATKREVDPYFLYEFLLAFPIQQKEYRRHFSILKQKAVRFPKIQTGEQQKIADCLSSLDELIELQAKQLEALQTHKKGLMQQLFPQEIDL